MNRQQRRRANRQLRRAGAHARVEGGLIPCCGWPECGVPVGFGITDMAEASDKLRQHYVDEHDGREPA